MIPFTEPNAISRINDISVSFKPEKTPTAQLFLYRSEKMGEGNHSCVYRASLRLPTPLYARDSPHNVVFVVAKLLSHWYEKDSLDNEANMYERFEKHLAEDWCGFNQVEGMKQPVKAQAVVPKFYGYYLPDEENDDNKTAGGEDKSQNNRWGRYDWTLGSPILLLENCGTQIEPVMLTLDQRYVLPPLHV